MHQMNCTIQTPSAKELINEILSSVDGELTSRSRVIDGLLDLRNAGDLGGELQIRVDELLRGVPGVTTVPNGWWLDRLEELRLLD